MMAREKTSPASYDHHRTVGLGSRGKAYRLRNIGSSSTDDSDGGTSINKVGEALVAGKSFGVALIQLERVRTVRSEQCETGEINGTWVL